MDTLYVILVRTVHVLGFQQSDPCKQHTIVGAPSGIGYHRWAANLTFILFIWITPLNALLRSTDADIASKLGCLGKGRDTHSGDIYGSESDCSVSVKNGYAVAVQMTCEIGDPEERSGRIHHVKGVCVCVNVQVHLYEMCTLTCRTAGHQSYTVNKT